MKLKELIDKLQALVIENDLDVNKTDVYHDCNDMFLSVDIVRVTKDRNIVVL